MKPAGGHLEDLYSLLLQQPETKSKQGTSNRVMRLLKMCISSSTEIKMFFSISNIGQTEQKLSSAFRINIIYTLFSLHYNTVPSDSRFHFNCLLRVLWHSLMILYTTIWDCLSWKYKIRTRRECVKSEGQMY